jgi:RNA polymerase sigma factor (sigma-70 family)
MSTSAASDVRPSAWDWPAVYRELAPSLLRLGRRRFGLSSDDCRDALQNAALSILRAGPAARDRRAYLTSCFLHECADLLRKRWREAASELTEESRVADPRARLEATLALHRALHFVTPGCRQLVEDWGLRGFKRQEAGRRLGLSPAAAYKQLSRCLDRLLKALS